MKLEEYSPLALAYIGDAHYNMTVKQFVIEKEVKMDLMQKHANRYVSAKSQAKFMDALLESNFLTEEEIYYYKRGRNTKSHSAPKNTDTVTYHVSTGFESMWGYLYLSNQQDRMGQIWDQIRTMEEE